MPVEYVIRLQLMAGVYRFSRYFLQMNVFMIANTVSTAVSYTHLDVYKRQVTGGAWLSSARVVRCWVKSRNERNPYL